MMTSIPEKAMFDCKPDALIVFDQAQMGELLRGSSMTPWMRFEVGAGNILESEPLRATQAGGALVKVQCRSDEVTLDLHEESARKIASDGRAMVYMGGLDEANDGRGWIPAG